MLRTWQAGAVALAGGLALDAAFPPIGFWPLAAAGPALLVLALWRRSLRGSFVIGLIFGVAFFFPLLSWLLNVAWYAWAALAGADTVIFAVLAIGHRLLLRLRLWPLAVAGWWVAVESLRDRWPYGGFPWGRLVMSQAAPDAVLGRGGRPLPADVPGRAGRRLPGVADPGPHQRQTAPAPAPARARGAGGRCPGRPAGRRGTGPGGPLLPVDGGAPPPPRRRSPPSRATCRTPGTCPTCCGPTTVTANHAAATRQLAARVKAGTAAAPDVVIWPENSTDQDPSGNPYVYATIAQAVTAINRPVLVGAILQDPVRNAGQLWRPRVGPVQDYVKRQLVPFGEMIPMRSFLDTFTSLPSLQPDNFTPGHKAVVFHVGKIRLGDVICYEVGFDGLVCSEVAAGANLLAVQTNDADFELDGQTGETLQQLDMARIRAIEHDRAVVVASTTGVSAIIAPDGRLIARTGLWERAEIEARVPLLTSTTLADRLGGWPEVLLSWATVAAMAWALAGAIRQQRQRPPGGRRPARGRPGRGVLRIASRDRIVRVQHREIFRTAGFRTDEPWRPRTSRTYSDDPDDPA